MTCSGQYEEAAESHPAIVFELSYWNYYHSEDGNKDRENLMLKMVAEVLSGNAMAAK